MKMGNWFKDVFFSKRDKEKINYQKYINKAFKKNPAPALLTKKDFKIVKKKHQFEKGDTLLLGKEISFSDNNGFLHSLEEIFKGNTYKFISKNKSPFIIDAGANIGLSVIYFKQQYPESKIIAFEPDENIFKILSSNINSFGYKDIDLRQTAAWVENTELKFYSEGSLAGSSEVDFIGKNEVSIVQAERLKDFIRNKKVDFLKIDIEGAENSVIFDIAEDLENVEFLFLEYHSIAGKDQLLGEILEIIKKARFRYYIKTAADHGIVPFIDRIEQRFDLQLNIFCYRL